MAIREMGISEKIWGLSTEVETALVFLNPSAYNLEAISFFHLPILPSLKSPNL